MQAEQGILLPVKKIAPDAVRVERLLPGPIERVWDYLVDADKRAQWFAGGEMEKRVGGQATLLFNHKNFADEPTPERYKEMDKGGFKSTVEVTAFDPPHRLAYTWPEGSHVSEVIFELTPQDNQVRLVLTHKRLRDAAQMANISSGWQAHLEVLAEVLAGRKAKGFWSNVARLEKAYGKEFGA